MRFIENLTDLPIKLHFYLSVWNSDSQSVAVEVTHLRKSLDYTSVFRGCGDIDRRWHALPARPSHVLHACCRIVNLLCIARGARAQRLVLCLIFLSPGTYQSIRAVIKSLGGPLKITKRAASFLTLGIVLPPVAPLTVKAPQSSALELLNRLHVRFGRRLKVPRQRQRLV